ncbi:hypothetical protein QUG75_23405, partial [Enterobacter hormaechei]
KVVPECVIVQKININVECRIKNANRRERPGHIAFKLIQSFFRRRDFCFSPIFGTAPGLNSPGGFKYGDDRNNAVRAGDIIA